MSSLLEILLHRLKAALQRVQLLALGLMCIGILAAYLVGIYFTGPFHSSSRWMGAMLACTSVVVVLQKSNYRESVSFGWSRVLGTFAGALIAYIYLRLFHFSVVGMLGCVIVLETLFMLINIYNNGHIATITMLIILLISQMYPHANPLINCTLRFFESVIGVGIGVVLLGVAEQWTHLRERVASLRKRHR
jgi:uncharacterized membrane protein YccC